MSAAATFLDKSLLRLACEPTTHTGELFHKHQCPKCETTWAHLDLLPHLGLAHEDFDEAHTCPKCGTQQFDKLLNRDERTKWAHAKMVDLMGGFR